jgi:hypothetical protein
VINAFTSGDGGFVDADAVAEYVYVVDITEPQRYTSVHYTEQGALQRIQQVAAQWGVPVASVVSDVIEKVVENP